MRHFLWVIVIVRGWRFRTDSETGIVSIAFLVLHIFPVSRDIASVVGMKGMGLMAVVVFGNADR